MTKRQTVDIYSDQQPTREGHPGLAAQIMPPSFDGPVRTVGKSPALAAPQHRTPRALRGSAPPTEGDLRAFLTAHRKREMRATKQAMVNAQKSGALMVEIDKLVQELTADYATPAREPGHPTDVA